MSKLEKTFKKLKHYDEMYSKGQPLLSDTEYDSFRRKLEKKVSSDKTELGSKIKSYLSLATVEVRKSKRDTVLPFIITSLAKVTNSSWARLKTLLKLLGDAPVCVLSPKLDGVSITLEYTNGKLTNAFTKGTGKVAQSKIEHVKSIPCVPKLVKTLVDYGKVYVRGEVIFSTNNFRKYEGKEIEGVVYKEARSAASGWLNSKSINDSVAQDLHFIAYNIQNSDGSAFVKAKTKENMLGKWLKDFKTLPMFELATLNASTVTKVLSDYRNGCLKCGYEIDGIVVEVNSLILINTLEKSNSTKYPKSAVAWKLSAAEEAKMQGKETKLTHYTISVSKTGLLFPTLHFTPVTYGNSTISKVSGKNFLSVTKNGFVPKTKVLVVKAGGVIPEIFHKSPKEIKPITFDSLNLKCLCGAKAEFLSPDAFCSKPKKCKYVKLALLTHSLKVTKLIALGEKNIQKLFDAGYTDLPSLIQAKEKHLRKLEGFGDSLITTITVGLKEKLKAMKPYELMDCSGIFARQGLALSTSTLKDLSSGAMGDGERHKLYRDKLSAYEKWYSDILTYLFNLEK